MGGNSCLLPLLFEEKRFFAWPLESSEGTTSSFSPESATEPDLKALLCKEVGTGGAFAPFSPADAVSWLALSLCPLSTSMENSGNSFVCDPHPPLAWPPQPE